MATRVHKTDWSRLIRRRLWPTVKNSRAGGAPTGSPYGAPVSRGIQAEGFVRELLRQAGVVAVQSYEASGVDGGIPRHHPPDWTTKTQLEKLLEWKNARDWLTFDVKYFEFLSDRHGLDYPFHPAKENGKRETSLYIIVFEGLDDFVALVPKGTYDQQSDFGYGIHPLMLRVMAWCFPFMVHKDDLKAAFDSIVDAREGLWYRNPTTGVVFTGWVPRIDKNPPLFPDPSLPRVGSSSQIVMALLQTINTVGKTKGIFAELNQVAPCICDFLIQVPGFDEPLRIEHKSRVDMPFSATVGKRSPWSKNRAWHYIILERVTGGEPEFFVAARYSVTAEWSTISYMSEDFLRRHFRLFEGVAAVSDMLDFMCTDAANAARAAENVIANAIPGDMADEELLSSSTDLSRFEVTSEQHKQEILLAGRKSHSRGLPWLCTKLNDQAQQGGELFVMPLDMGHPVCNHVAVRWTWSEEDRARYNSIDKQLPKHIFDSRLQNKDAIALRFADFSGGTKDLVPSGWQWTPASMRPAYWLKPVENQHFITVFTPLRAKAAQVFDSYGILPSQQTKQFDTDERRQPICSPKDVQPEPGQSQEQARSDARCRAYFHQVEQAELILKAPAALSRKGTGVRLRIGKNGDYTQKDLEPLRHMVKLGDGSIYGHLRALLNDDDPDMRVQSAQSTEFNPSFQKSLYRVKVRDLLQAMWDYGLLRRKRRAGDNKGSKNTDAADAFSGSESSNDGDEGDGADSDGDLGDAQWPEIG